MRLKQLWYILSLIVIVLLTASCATPAEAPETESSAASATYYNDYLGVSITVPEGWQINVVSENLSLQQGETSEPRLIQYADGSSRLELLDIQNTAESSSPEHSRFYAYAEIFPEQVDVVQYMDLLLSLLQSGNASYTYSLQKQEQIPLARHMAERICLQVSADGYEQTYIEEYYIISLKTAFLIFYINYWPQNDVSRTAAHSMLDHIILPVP